MSTIKQFISAQVLSKMAPLGSGLSNQAGSWNVDHYSEVVLISLALITQPVPAERVKPWWKGPLKAFFILWAVVVTRDALVPLHSLWHGDKDAAYQIPNMQQLWLLSFLPCLSQTTLCFEGSWTECFPVIGDPSKMSDCQENCLTLVQNERELGGGGAKEDAPSDYCHPCFTFQSSKLTELALGPLLDPGTWYWLTLSQWPCLEILAHWLPHLWRDFQSGSPRGRRLGVCCGPSIQIRVNLLIWIDV